MTSGDEAFWEQELERLLPEPAEALEEAFRYVCCPVCEVLADVPWDFFRALPMRWPDEPDLRGAVMRAGGFCNHHTWRLVEMQSLVALATVYADIMGKLAEQGPEAIEPCPVCRLERLAADRLLGLLVERLRTEEGRDRFGRLFGLCYPHWREMLGRELPPALREFMLRSQADHARRLQSELIGFLEKDTAELKGTRTRDENRAPRRAALKTAGNEDI
ncbi:MAG: hypothetical protein AB7Y46_03865 [Armatimonadota bacterium]